MAFSTSIAADALGVFCRVNLPRGKPSTAISANGKSLACGSVSMTACAYSCDKKKGATRNLRQLSSDSQSVKTIESGGVERSYDGGKKVAGRKRQVIVDMLGLVAVVHSAATQDYDGARRKRTGKGV